MHGMLLTSYWTYRFPKMRKWLKDSISYQPFRILHRENKRTYLPLYTKLPVQTFNLSHEWILSDLEDLTGIIIGEHILNNIMHLTMAQVGNYVRSY